MANDLQARLRRIADASRREDGTDIPLGVQLREAADRLDVLESDNRQKDARIQELEVALREARQDFVTAWDGLPEGYHRPREIERWLLGDMKPAAERARSALGRNANG